MNWYAKTALLSGLALFMVAGCVPQTKTGKGADGVVVPVADSGQAAGRISKPTRIGVAMSTAVSSGNGSRFGEMMDMQEQEMRSAMAKSEASTIQRQGDLLLVRLKGDLAFDKNSVAVRPGLFAEAERMSNVLNRYPQTVVQVCGHTDSQGSATYNQTLSQQRADAVKNLMVQLGVSQDRIEAVAYGESQPIAANENEAGRMLNRRVEIKIAPWQ